MIKFRDILKEIKITPNIPQLEIKFKFMQGDTIIGEFELNSLRIMIGMDDKSNYIRIPSKNFHSKIINFLKTRKIPFKINSEKTILVLKKFAKIDYSNMNEIK